MKPQASEHWSVRYVADACDRCPECCVTEPTACEQLSTDACASVEWSTYTAIAAKARLVEDGSCVVVEQGLPTGVEGSIGFGLGLCLALLWATFFR